MAGRLSDARLNTFCRLFDLVFAEFGTHGGQPVLWFVDFKNTRVCYSREDIERSLEKRGVK